MASKVTPPPESISPRWPAEVADRLRRAEQLLQEEGPEPTLAFLAKTRDASPWVINARGGCLLRLGEAGRALDLFRGLVQGSMGLSLKEDAPTTFKTNYATAQLLAGNLTGCIVTLGQIQDEGHPSVKRLRAAIRRWEQSLSFWSKIRWFLGGDVGQ